MRIPKNCDLQVKTDTGTVELHITAVITTRTAAAELIAAIRQFSGALEAAPRVRKPKGGQAPREAA